MNSLRSRFILSHILPIMVTIPFVAFALIYIIETQVLLKSLSQNLTESALLITEAVEEHPEIWEDQESAREISAQLSFKVQAQILLIAPNGDILAYDPEYFEGTDQEIDRLGLNKARRGETSINIAGGGWAETGDGVGPVFDNESKLVGIVGLTQTLEGTASEFNRLRNLILMILIVELIFAAILGLGMALSLSAPRRFAPNPMAIRGLAVLRLCWPRYNGHATLWP